MTRTSPQKIVSRRSMFITGGFFIALSLAYISAFANPPGSPYQAGATLDPTCAPGDTNCFVQIIPDQTGHAGEYLTTDGSVMSWASVTVSPNLQQVTTAGNTTDTDIVIADSGGGDKFFSIKPVGTTYPVISLRGSTIQGGTLILSDGLDTYRSFIGTAILSANQTINFPNASGTVALLSTTWGLQGNAGTIPGTDFIGTTDNVDLVLKRNNVETFRLRDNYAVQMGSSTTASGPKSLSIGENTLASGDISVAMGFGSVSSGAVSAAFGTSTASGTTSIAMGAGTTASGNYSTSIGVSSIASGEISSALGYFTESKSYGGTVVGIFNDSTNAASPTSTNPLNRIFQIGNGTANNARSNAMTVLGNGNIGIGNLTPGFLLHVGSSSITDGTTLMRLQDTNSVCDFNANTGAPTCGSDLTLKKDVTSLSTSDLLSKISSLNPVSYHWLTEGTSAPLQYGFIAQEVATQFPDLVTDHTWIDGTTRKFLNMSGLMPYVVGAVREMNIKLSGISDISTPNPWRDVLTAWLSNATNRISRIFTGEICLTDPDGSSECITKSELHQLKQLLNQTPPPSGGGGGGGDTPPATDTCPNIDGDQAQIPEGYHLDGSTCVEDQVTPPTDGGTEGTDVPPVEIPAGSN